MAGTAVVTGGGSGIGRALCLEMVSRGYQIVVSDMDIDQAEMTAREIRRHGGSAVALCCDVTDEKQVAELAETAILTYGVPDLVFSNIGNGIRIQDSYATARKDMMALPGLNVFGMWNVAARFAEAAVGAGRPTRIIFTVSECGIRGPFGGSGSMIYGAIKHATLAMAESMREELRGLQAEISILCLDQTQFNFKSSNKKTAACPGIETDRPFRQYMDHAAGICMDGVEQGDFYIFASAHAFENINDKGLSCTITGPGLRNNGVPVC